MASKKKKKKIGISQKYILLALGFVCLIFIALVIQFQRNTNVPKSVTFSPQNIENSKSHVLFSDGNVLYKASLDSSRPKKIGRVPRVITAISPLQNGDIVLSGGGKYFGKKGKLKKDWDYESEGEAINEKHWILKKGEKSVTALSESEYDKVQSEEALRKNEYYYSEEVPTGGADILVKKVNGTTEKIGHLNNKIDLVEPCESSYYMDYPKEFTTYSGKFLFGRPARGGGICTSEAHVVSRDGGTIYTFKDNVRNAAWIGENKMLVNYFTGDNIDVVTFNVDGTTDVSLVTKTHEPYGFNSTYLSPSKKYLYLGYAGGLNYLENAAVYDIKTGTITKIDAPVSRAKWSATEDLLLIEYGYDAVDDSTDSYMYQISIYNPVTNKSNLIGSYASGRDANPIFVLD